jgi:calcineurin-like phosphoesterase family protein
MDFFTADHHFYHDPIIEMCNRPYKTGHQMHKDIIRKHNERVTNNDIVYFVGDVSFSKDKEPIRRIISKLNGQKHLILGNHDYLNPFDYVDIGFISVHTSLEIFTEFGNYILVHDPAISQIDRTRIFLCGHIHDLFLKQKNCINVGVDVHNFYPISIQQIKEIEDAI